MDLDIVRNILKEVALQHPRDDDSEKLKALRTISRIASEAPDQLRLIVNTLSAARPYFTPFAFQQLGSSPSTIMTAVAARQYCLMVGSAAPRCCFSHCRKEVTSGGSGCRPSETDLEWHTPILLASVCQPSTLRMLIWPEANKSLRCRETEFSGQRQRGRNGLGDSRTPVQRQNLARQLRQFGANRWVPGNLR
jgi:hypothetical protein